MFQNLVQNYKNAKKLMGETIIRELTGYDPEYVEKNIKIPEFQHKIKENIKERIKRLKEKNLITKEGMITEEGIRIASIALYYDELDKIRSKGIGDEEKKKRGIEGEKEDTRPYKRGRDKYRDIALKRSIKQSLRRKHQEIQKEDLQAYERAEKGRIEIIYAMDSSGSMKGKKIRNAKRAGVALAYKTIIDDNKAGLIIFDSKIKKEIPPTKNLNDIIIELTRTRAGQETNIALAIKRAIELFSKGDETKQIVIITDGVSTRGEGNPLKEAEEAASIARSKNIRITIIGIDLEKEGEELARKVTEITRGRILTVRNIDELDTIVLEEISRIE